MPEKTIAIRVQEDFFKKIKLRLADNGMTLKDYIIALIEADLAKPNADEKAEVVITGFDGNELETREINQEDLRKALQIFESFLLNNGDIKK